MDRKKAGTLLGPGGEKTHFTISETAALFGLTVQALHHWIRTGRIRRHERTSRRGNYLIPRDEVARLLAERGHEVRGLWVRERPKVLVIDDDPGIRRFVLAVARSPNVPLSLRTSPSVEEGLLRAAQFRPDVILLDTSFPKNKLRGDQGLTFIRGTKLLQKTRVVVMVDDPRAGAGMLRGGADAVLLKPFGLSELRSAIEMNLGRKAGEKRREGARADDFVLDISSARPIRTR